MAEYNKITKQIQYVGSPNLPLDYWYGPYENIAKALEKTAATTVDGVQVTRRYVGMTVGIVTNNTVEEYWFNGGIEDNHLVKKQQESGTLPGNLKIATFSGGNNPNVTGVMNSIISNLDGNVKLPANEFVYEGYTFDGWKYGDSTSSYIKQSNEIVTLTNQLTKFSATWKSNSSEQPTQYTITTEVAEGQDSWGSVDGGGSYNAGGTATLTATPYEHYTFLKWNDGDTNATRDVTVTANATYTAYFSANTYQITTEVTPVGSGTVTGDGTFDYGSSTTLTATANTGYNFVKWTDGNNDNPRPVTVTENKTYTAEFKAQEYTVNLSIPNEGGTVEVNGETYRPQQSVYNIQLQYGLQTFKVAVNDSHVLGSILVNETPISLDDNNSFSVNVNSEDINIVVTFNEQPQEETLMFFTTSDASEANNIANYIPTTWDSPISGISSLDKYIYVLTNSNTTPKIRYKNALTSDTEDVTSIELTALQQPQPIDITNDNEEFVQNSGYQKLLLWVINQNAIKQDTCVLNKE